MLDEKILQWSRCLHTPRRNFKNIIATPRGYHRSGVFNIFEASVEVIKLFLIKIFFLAFIFRRFS
jgi:hypothetical protein